MKQIMIDLETLSLRSDAMILQIGAVALDALGVYEQDTFLCNVSAHAGFDVSTETLKWWQERPEELRMSLYMNQHHITDALENFNKWCGNEPFHIWAKSAGFDLAVLRFAYMKMGVPIPWHYRAERCYRTAAATLPFATFVPPAVAHRADNDAIAQARHLLEIRDVVLDVFGFDLFNCTEDIQNAFTARHTVTVIHPDNPDRVHSSES